MHFFFCIHISDTGTCADHHRRVPSSYPDAASGGDSPGLAAVGVLLTSGGHDSLPGAGVEAFGKRIYDSHPSHKRALRPLAERSADRNPIRPP